MESRLPQIQPSVGRSNGVSSQILIALSVIALLLVLVFGGVNVGVSGISEILLLLIAALIAGALLTLRSLMQRVHLAEERDVVRNELLGHLAELNRRATLISNIQGDPVVSNQAFGKLAGSHTRSITDLFSDQKGIDTYFQLISEIRHRGEGSACFDGKLEQLPQFHLSGVRLGNYIKWSIHSESVALRLKNEAAHIETIAAPVLNSLKIGFAVEDGDGNLHAVNGVLREWLGLSDDEKLPEALDFTEAGDQLVAAHGRNMHVKVITTPIHAREKGENIGQIRFIQAVDFSKVPVDQFSLDGLDSSLLDMAPIAVAIVDPKGKIEQYNRALVRMVCEDTPLSGRNVKALVQEDEQGAVIEAVKAAVHGKPLDRPIDVHLCGTKDNSAQIYFASIRVGSENFAVLYVVDKTQEKQFERQFVQAQKMQAVGQLAGGIAHDFNNLLTAIIGFCDLLLLRHDTGDQSYSDLIQIKQNSNRAANLVRQLLAFSRQQVVKLKVLEVSHVLTDLSNLIRRLIGENIELDVTHGRNLPRIKADQGQLEQVVINLAVNARDAMPNGGKLSIESRIIKPTDSFFSEFDGIDPGNYIVLEVRDTGTGMSSDVIEKIFEPFFTTKSVGEGTGLGLATVYGIVKQANGYVFCRSELGVGTSFFVLLPALDASEEGEKKEEAKSKARDLSGKGTILLVEDEDSVRLFAARALSSKGYKVIEAASAEIALEKLEAEADDIMLMITDVVMPEMDGPTLVEHVRKDHPDLPVIFVSGYTENLLTDELKQSNNHFLAKPFSLKALAELVKTILGAE